MARHTVTARHRPDPELSSGTVGPRAVATDAHRCRAKHTASTQRCEREAGHPGAHMAKAVGTYTMAAPVRWHTWMTRR